MKKILVILISVLCLISMSCSSREPKRVSINIDCTNAHENIERINCVSYTTKHISKKDKDIITDIVSDYFYNLGTYDLSLNYDYHKSELNKIIDDKTNNGITFDFYTYMVVPCKETIKIEVPVETADNKHITVKCRSLEPVYVDFTYVETFNKIVKDYYKNINFFDILPNHDMYTDELNDLIENTCKYGVRICFMYTYNPKDIFGDK